VRRASLALLTLAGVAVAAAAAAQQRRPFPPRPLGPAALEQPTLSFSVSQSLEADTNYDLVNDPGGTTYYGETRFTADYLRDTGTQRLGFGIDTGLRGIDQPEEDFEWIAASPSLAYLGYRGEGIDSLVDAELVARSRVVDSIQALDVIVDPDVDPLDPDPLDQFRIDAREYRYDANLGFTLGTSSPSTWGLRLLATSYDYDQESRSLTPRTTLNPQANWVLQLNPVLSGALFGGYYYYNADNDAETEIRVAEADAGLIYAPSEVLRLGFGLGYADRREEETDTFGVREETEHETGPVVRADLRYVLPDFTVAGNVRWTTAAAEDNRFSGVVSASYFLPRGRLFGQIYQRAVGSSAGNQVKVTGAKIGLEHEINTVSRIGLDLAYATQIDLDETDEPDITRTDLTASYEYDITAVVSAEVGYQYQTREEDPIDADSHRVYLLLGRAFETGL
jgi:hypothetical protein